MNNKRASEILKLLQQEYPDVTPPLHFHNPFELLIATILSAQTTDIAVNKVTPILFVKYPDAQSLSQGDLEWISDVLRPIGLYVTKAQRIIETAKILVGKHDGEVPQNMTDLLELPGVGRKVASVVLWQAFGINSGFTVDTHVLRLSRWLGLSEHDTPQLVERDLMQLFPQEEWGDTSLRLIFLGRSKLTARNPQFKGTVWEKYVKIKMHRMRCILV